MTIDGVHDPPFSAISSKSNIEKKPPLFDSWQASLPDLNINIYLLGVKGGKTAVQSEGRTLHKDLLGSNVHQLCITTDSLQLLLCT